MTEKNSAYLACVNADVAGQRLDNFLLKILKGVPKTRVYKAVRKGEVRVNKKRSAVSYRLAIGDQVRVPPLRQAEAKQVELAKLTFLANKLVASIVYEDDDIIAINKPAGIAVHAGTGCDIGVIEALRMQRPGYLELAHRLDRATSGCLVLIKNRARLLDFHNLLAANAVNKTYRCIVDGRWCVDQVTLDQPLMVKSNTDKERKTVVSVDGKNAVTHVKLKECFANSSYLEVGLETGRTHQIRVHLSDYGYPIIGDTIYGDVAPNWWQLDLKPKMMLHAANISFAWPDGGKISIECKLTKEFVECLQYVQSIKP